MAVPGIINTENQGVPVVIRYAFPYNNIGWKRLLYTKIWSIKDKFWKKLVFF